MRTHRLALRTSRTPVWKRPVAALVILAAATALSACGVDYNLVIHDNDTVDLSYTVWDSSGLETITEETCNEDLIPSDSGPFPKGTDVTYTYTTHGKDPACEVSGKAIPLSELNDQNADWSVTHEGREYVFSLSPSALTDAGGQGGMAETAASMTANVSVTFPGEVSSANGKIDGNTVTWKGLSSESETLQARGGDGSSALLYYGLIGAGIAVPLIVAALVIILVVRRRRRRARAAAQGLAQDPQQVYAPGAAADPSYPMEVSAQAPAGQPAHQYQAGQTPATASFYSPSANSFQPPQQGYAPDAGQPGSGQSGSATGAAPQYSPTPSEATTWDEPYPRSPIPGHPAAPYQPTAQAPAHGGTSPHDAAQEAALPTQRVPITGQPPAQQPPPGHQSPQYQPYYPPSAPDGQQ